ncbi:zinc finger BED domain-containing protein RICESLEEPER 2-like [Nicotiana sylvestris]|uniref:zinc finger BED domain-containing protein RICESLEEPER 2-like n=1 Tax=Nicotiana sylvestris TaxID=4096 RepID=UPI00388C86D1
MIGKYSCRYCLGNKIFSISFYRENPNELAVNELKHRYVTCACHVLNSIVTDGIAHFQPELRKIREAMRYMKICHSRENEFYKRFLAQNHKAKYLTTDIPTRWNSTYEMLVLAFMCKPILTEAYNESLDYKDKNGLNNINWDICEEIVKFLGQFCFATAHFSILIYLNDIASLLFRFKDKPFFSDIIPNMRAIFIKHFIPVPPIYLLGALLDPMMKLQHIELSLKFLYQNLELNYSEQDLSSHKNDLIKLANEIYSDYEVKLERTQPPVPPSSSSSSSSKRFPGCEFWEQHVVMPNESKRSSNMNKQ